MATSAATSVSPPPQGPLSPPYYPSWASIIIFPFGFLWFVISVPIVGILRLLRVVPPPRVPRKGPVLRDQIAIVTGSNCGVGKLTALELGRRGCTVILGCRDPEKGKATEMELNSMLKTEGSNYGGHFVYMRLDLNSIAGVDKFCQEFLKRYGRLDILINNAGRNTSGGLSPDGYDIMFTVNYLGHFRLTQNLMPLMRARHRQNDGLNQKESEARIVNLSSVMHHFGDEEWTKHLNDTNSANTYSSSKVSMILFTRTINNRSKIMEKGHHGIRSFSVNPGAVRSEIWRKVPEAIKPLYDIFMRLIYLEPSQGCMPSVAAACENFPKDVEYLQPYLLPYGIALPFEVLGPFVGYAPMVPRLSSEKGAADAAARRLVQISETAIKAVLDREGGVSDKKGSDDELK